jgi:hypothetical protein
MFKKIYNAMFNRASQPKAAIHIDPPQMSLHDDGGPPMQIEIAKAVNGHIVRGFMYNPNGPDFNEFRLVPEGADLIAEIAAVIASMKLK